MALFKPKGSSSNGNKFAGLCELAIIGFEDKSAQFEWADIFIEAEVRVKGSEYSRAIKIKGSLEKDNKGKVTGGSVLNRMYKFFADIGCTAGINAKGEWEDDSGNPIKDIAKYLLTNHKSSGEDFVGYIYKEPNKKTGKAYNTCHYRIWPNTSTGHIELASHVKWMKTNGYLKEAPVNSVPIQTTAFPEGSGIEDVL
jgi:hypothetical protein